MNQPVTNTYPTEPSINRGELPDPFALPDGGRVRTREEAPSARRPGAT